jgi:hypothetical protein
VSDDRVQSGIFASDRLSVPPLRAPRHGVGRKVQAEGDAGIQRDVSTARYQLLIELNESLYLIHCFKDGIVFKIECSQSILIHDVRQDFLLPRQVEICIDHLF